MNRWPYRAEAVKNGCRCKWWGDSAIVRFDPSCPILRQHKNVPTTLFAAFPTTWGDIRLLEAW